MPPCTQFVPAAWFPALLPLPAATFFVLEGLGEGDLFEVCGRARTRNLGDFLAELLGDFLVDFGLAFFVLPLLLLLLLLRLFAGLAFFLADGRDLAVLGEMRGELMVYSLIRIKHL